MPPAALFPAWKQTRRFPLNWCGIALKTGINLKTGQVLSAIRALVMSKNILTKKAVNVGQREA